jgi:hypothetical protein
MSTKGALAGGLSQGMRAMAESQKSWSDRFATWDIADLEAQKAHARNLERFEIEHGYKMKEAEFSADEAMKRTEKQLAGAETVAGMKDAKVWDIESEAQVPMGTVMKALKDGAKEGKSVAQVSEEQGWGGEPKDLLAGASKNEKLELGKTFAATQVRIAVRVAAKKGEKIPKMEQEQMYDTALGNYIGGGEKEVLLQGEKPGVTASFENLSEEDLNKLDVKANSPGGSGMIFVEWQKMNDVQPSAVLQGLGIAASQKNIRAMKGAETKMGKILSQFEGDSEGLRSTLREVMRKEEASPYMKALAEAEIARLPKAPSGPGVMSAETAPVGTGIERARKVVGGGLSKLGTGLLKGMQN